MDLRFIHFLSIGSPLLELPHACKRSGGDEIDSEEA